MVALNRKVLHRAHVSTEALAEVEGMDRKPETGDRRPMALTDEGASVAQSTGHRAKSVSV